MDCPTQIVAMVLKSQFLPRKQIKHLRRQRQQNQIEYDSGQCQEDTVNIGGVSIADYTFAEVTNVSRLGISYSLGKFAESAAWLDVPLPCSILWTEFVLQWKVWWMLAQSPSSPSTLEIKSIKVDHRWCQQRALHVVVWTCFAPTKRARSHSTLRLSSQSSRGERLQRKIVVACTAGFRADPTRSRCYWHDAVQVWQEMQTAFNRHTPLLLKVRFDRWSYALITVLPRALGTEVFLRGRSDLNIGAGRWLWSDRPLAVSSVKTSHLPNARRGHSIHPGRRRGTYFQGAWISILAWENMCSAFCGLLVHFAFMMRFIG